jgi:hypothetical protein
MRIPVGTYETANSSWQTHAVPRTDSFSYTRAGQPWYAWEWLYDAGIGAILHVAGLNGVVLFTTLIIACHVRASVSIRSAAQRQFCGNRLLFCPLLLLVTSECF